MSIPLMIETQSEVRRLLIAGSELASEDFRLKKLLPQIKKAGENVQVFARVADAVEKVIDPGIGKSSEKLLELANIVNAILYTQGQTTVAGDIVDIDSADIELPTNNSYRRLKPVIEALTNKGSGRLEIIRKAWQDGIFKDIRLIKPLIEALGESYQEISYNAYQILRQYGRCIVPILKKSLDKHGGKSEARKVELISELSGKGENSLFLELLKDSSLDIKISAVNALKHDGNNEEILLEYTYDKKKELREAAYNALSALDTENGDKRLSEVFFSKDRINAIAALRDSKSEYITKIILQEAEKALDILLKSVKTSGLIVKKYEITATDDDISNFKNLLECLTNKKHEIILAFYKDCLQHTKILVQLKSSIGYGEIYNLPQIIAANILSMGTKEAYEMMNSTLDKYDNSLIAFCFHASLLSDTTEEVYNKFYKYAARGRQDLEGQEILGMMDGLVRFEYDIPVYNYPGSHIYTFLERLIGLLKVNWDKRWLKLLIRLDEEDLICRMAMRGDEECIRYLLKKVEACHQNKKGCWNHLHGLIQARYPKSVELAIDILKSSFEHTGFYSTELDVLKLLPPEAANLIEEFAHTYNGSSEARRLFKIAQDLRGI
jgi:hypothetical protein